jgi:phytoene synthase
MSRRATTFYYSFLALPPEKRRAIVAVWDFCRAVDDAVDESKDGTAACSLAEWRTELKAMYEGVLPATPQGRQLMPYVSMFNLPRSAFEDLIDGVAMDLDERRYETFEALRQYCLRVASAVGLICVEIFGYRNVQARDYAIDLGIALQLTNIIRDVPADLRRGRVYIPLDDLRRFDVSEDDLRAGRATANVRALLAHQCDRAKEFYGKAAAALPKPDARGLVAAQIMAAIYRDLLKSIEHAKFDVFSRRRRVSRPRQAAIAAFTWLKVMVT